MPARIQTRHRVAAALAVRLAVQAARAGSPVVAGVPRTPLGIAGARDHISWGLIHGLLAGRQLADAAGCTATAATATLALTLAAAGLTTATLALTLAAAGLTATTATTAAAGLATTTAGLTTAALTLAAALALTAALALAAALALTLPLSLATTSCCSQFSITRGKGQSDDGESDDKKNEFRYFEYPWLHLSHLLHNPSNLFYNSF
jgi:hypothetical protein